MGVILLSVAAMDFFAPDDPLFLVIAVLLGSFRKRPKRGPEA